MAHSRFFKDRGPGVDLFARTRSLTLEIDRVTTPLRGLKHGEGFSNVLVKFLHLDFQVKPPRSPAIHDEIGNVTPLYGWCGVTRCPQLRESPWAKYRTLWRGFRWCFMCSSSPLARFKSVEHQRRSDTSLAACWFGNSFVYMNTNTKASLNFAGHEGAYAGGTHSRFHPQHTGPCPFGGTHLTLHRSDTIHDRWKLCLTGVTHCAPHLPIFFITMIIQLLKFEQPLKNSTVSSGQVSDILQTPTCRSCLDSESKRTSVTFTSTAAQDVDPDPVMTRPTQTHFGSAEAEANNLRLT